MKLRNYNILGVDTLWSDKVTEPKESIKPILDIVSSQTQYSYAYFPANTYEELVFALSKIKQSKAGILYLASHGEPNTFKLGHGGLNFVSIQDFSNLLDGALRYKGIHFSSCSFINIDRNLVLDFMHTTFASFISGYTKDVDWIESTCLDILFLNLVQTSEDLNKDISKFLYDYSELVTRTGFDVYIKE